MAEWFRARVRGGVVEIKSQLQVNAALLLLLLPLACSSSPPREQPLQTRTRFLMGTILSIESDLPPTVVEQVFDEVDRVERLITTWRSSPLQRLNALEPGESSTISVELADLLATTLHWRDETARAFEPAAGRLIQLWRTREEGRVPIRTEIENALAALSTEPFSITGELFTRKTNASIEEGGFGKGYALDTARSLIERMDPAGRALLDFSGQLLVVGDHLVDVAIADPADRGRPAIALSITGPGSLATSSGSERFFEVDGRALSHLIDPRTGLALPPRGSATVFHRSALLADILSTAMYVMGEEAGISWANSRDIAVIFILPDPDGPGWLVASSRRADTLSLRPMNDEFRIR